MSVAHINALLSPIFINKPFVHFISGGTKAEEPSPPWRIKIAMACLRIIRREESSTVSNSPLTLLYPDIKPIQQIHFITYYAIVEIDVTGYRS